MYSTSIYDNIGKISGRAFKDPLGGKYLYVYLQKNTYLTFTALAFKHMYIYNTSDHFKGT